MKAGKTFHDELCWSTFRSVRFSDFLFFSWSATIRTRGEKHFTKISFIRRGNFSQKKSWKCGDRHSLNRRTADANGKASCYEDPWHNQNVNLFSRNHFSSKLLANFIIVVKFVDKHSTFYDATIIRPVSTSFNRTLIALNWLTDPRCLALIDLDDGVGGLQLRNDDGREAEDQTGIDGTDVGDEGREDLSKSLSAFALIELRLGLYRRRKSVWVCFHNLRLWASIIVAN